MRGVVGQAFDGHGHDAWGLLCLALGLISALGIYGDLAGPAGGALDTGAGLLVGVARVLVPFALVLLGVRLIRGPGDDEARSIGAIVGSVLAGLSITGLLHLVTGGDADAWSREALRDGGGAIGGATAVPADALLGPWGSALLLGVVGLLGIVLITRVSVRTAADAAAAGVRPVGSWVSRTFGALFRLGMDEPDAGDADEASAEPVVTVAGTEDDVASKPRRTRKPKASEPETPEFARAEPITEVEQLEITLAPKAEGSPWTLPPLSVLDRAGAHEVDRGAVEEQGRALEAALAEHGVETTLVGMVVGPTVTRFELELGAGVKVARITSLHKDIAYAMASPDVRILAPIPGRQAIGVEVPNAQRQLVALGDLLASDEARNATEPLEVAIGRDINGRTVMADMAKMPHVLIAGATGAGKSSCINSIITSVLMRTTPEQVRLILIDPKRVELGQYNGLPHLLTQVVTNPKKAANALSWAVKEMERRYDLLSEAGFRDITGYNEAFDRGDLVPKLGEDRTYARLSFIMVVVDELNDLMMVAARDVEDSICRIAQMARAVGIHLVIATQRPSVNVITGVIKANVPSRLAFAVSSLADSRVILDQPGAERLIGRGDMLLLGSSSNVPQRIQGAWVTEDEVRSVVGHWRAQQPEVPEPEVVLDIDEVTADAVPGMGGTSGDDDDDDLLAAARELIVRSQLGSTSMLQRKLRVGFARAGRIMDLLEQQGVVGPSEGSKAREVLMTVEELEAGAA